MITDSTTEQTSLDVQPENEASPLCGWSNDNEIDQKNSTSLHHTLQWKLNQTASVDSTGSENSEEFGNNNNKQLVMEQS